MNFPSSPTLGQLYPTDNPKWKYNGFAWDRLSNASILTKTDVGLGNVDNTSDLSKPISTAVQLALDGKLNVGGTAVAANVLATARLIGGVSFDGSADITLPGVNAVGNQNTTGSAATLTTARTINGTSFNGSANITTANWGTTRTLTIGSTGKSVNGSINVSWSLAEIGAAAVSHTHALTDLTDFAVTSPTNGQALVYDSTSGKWKNGAGGGGGSGMTWVTVSAANVATAATDTGYLMATGGTARTITLPVNVPVGFYLLVHAIGGQVTLVSNGNTIAGVGAGNDLTIEGGNTVTLVANAIGALEILSASAPPAAINISDVSGLQTALDGKLATTGTAAAATKLATARTINGTSFDGTANITTASWGTSRNLTIGSTAKAVDGSANVSWSLAEIGAAAVSHTHVIGDVTGLQAALDVKQPWDPATQSTTATATLNVNSDTVQRAVVTAQNAALAIANPTGTPAEGRRLMYVIKDDGTARGLSFGTQFRGVGPNALPASTKASKRLRMGFEWCSADSKWDLIALLEET